MERSPESASPLRLAWVGDAAQSGGVPGLCRLFLLSLAERDVELHCFTRTPPETVPGLPSLTRRVTFHSFPFPWRWESWYGRNRRLAFLVGTWRRAAAFRQLARALLAEHRRQPFDAIVQFSQAELIGLRTAAPALPLLLFPCVHAAGELEWCRKEEPLARKCEAWWWRQVRFLQLWLRAGIQKRDYAAVKGVIGLSRRFNELVARDYALPAGRQGVVYHPIELAAASLDRRMADGKIRLLFVGRISVRKGVEVLVDAIPFLLARDAHLEVTIIGEGAQWSNYEPLLEALPAERCTWRKGLGHESVLAEMENSDVLLVPSSYEPGGIVVGEALAAGMVIAASDEVGSAERLPEDVRWTFPPRDPEAFVKATLAAAAAVRTGGLPLRRRARQVAEEQFAPAKVTADLLDCVRAMIIRRP